MLTEAEKATNFDTMRHIERVRNLLNVFVVELLKRGELHDQSKLESPEVEALTANTARLAGLTYGSPEYAANFRSPEMQAYVTHHYANNRHHPQYHKRGVNDMTLVDVLEMLVDWKAASERHADGNIRKSIEVNAGRFELSPQLTTILENTVRFFDLD
jgi:hypothetical protein